jgi:transcriptional regulator with XRE-family HTH domain
MPSSTPLKSERVALGRRIRQARTAKGLSKAEAARLVGVKVQSWQQWELGRTSPRPEKIPKLASVLEVSANWLLGIAFETAFGGSVQDASRTLQRNYGRAQEWLEQQEQRQRDIMAKLEHGHDRARQRKAFIEAYDRLRPDIQHWIRGLIETLDQAHEVVTRKKEKAG